MFLGGCPPPIKKKNLPAAEPREDYRGKNWSGKASEETTERNGRLCCELAKHKWENRGPKR